MPHLITLLLLAMPSGFLDFDTWLNKEAAPDTSRQHRIVLVIDDTLEAPEAAVTQGYGRVRDEEDLRLHRVRAKFIADLQAELAKRFDSVVVLDSVASADLDRRIGVMDRISKKSVLDARILSDSSRFQPAVGGQLVLYVNKLKFTTERVQNTSFWRTLLGRTDATPDRVEQLVLFSRFVLWDHRENRHVVCGKGDEKVESMTLVSRREWEKCLNGMIDNIVDAIPVKKLKRRK